MRERHGSAIWLFDFQRLRHAETMPGIFRALEPRMQERLRSDAIASEAAAFTYEELREALGQAGLGELRGGRDRPIAWGQAHWAPAKSRTPAPSPAWRDASLPLPVRFYAARLRRTFSGLPIR